MAQSTLTAEQLGVTSIVEYGENRFTIFQKESGCIQCTLLDNKLREKGYEDKFTVKRLNAEEDLTVEQLDLLRSNGLGAAPITVLPSGEICAGFDPARIFPALDTHLAAQAKDAKVA